MPGWPSTIVTIAFVPAAAYFFMWMPLLRSRTPERVFGAISRVDYGDATWQAGWSLPGVARGPIARLELRDDGVRFGPRWGWLGMAIPQVDLRWTDIRRVRIRRLTVDFERSDLDGAKINFRTNNKKLLESIASHGVPVG